ncbi:MAG TPA: basic secretory protein-like protein [Gemmataceae bacterium]|jgi:hypothetical protein|nr:basic secretory protein-like protein [Gemmataceae bacterium]
MNLATRWRMLFGVLVLTTSFAIAQNGPEKKADPEKKVTPEKKVDEKKADVEKKAEPEKKTTPEKKAAAFSVTIAGEVDAKLRPVAGQLVTEFYECYPRLVERFENPKRPAPHDIKITFAHIRVPAYCTGPEIKVDIDWLHKHPDDIGMITHELTHSVQGYRGGVPGWFVEGMADYTRLAFGPKEQPNWALPRRFSDKQSYKDSYRVTGRFFQWLEAKHPGVLDKMHRKAQDREFDLGDFRKLTGSTIDELWAQCVKELRAEKKDS